MAKSQAVECWCGYVYPVSFGHCPGIDDGKHERTPKPLKATVARKTGPYRKWTPPFVRGNE